MMVDIILTPPNLAKLGVKRQVPEPDADLLTVWDTPYPVLTHYKAFCKRCGLVPFGGGSYAQQGDFDFGYLMSGYRDDGGDSEHCHALALDMAAGTIADQIRMAPNAQGLFTRVGFYPARKILHLGLAPRVWMLKYGKTPFWIRHENNYKGFQDIRDAIDFAQTEYGGIT